MTTRIRVAVIVLAASALAVAGVALLLRHRQGAVSPPGPLPAGLDAPDTVPVLHGEGIDREILLKARFAAPARSAFTDATLAAALGAAATPEFLEVWVLNRGGGPISSLADPPLVRRSDGSTARLLPLASIAEPAGRRTGQQGVILAALAPDPAAPLGKSHLRRTVYAAPPGLSFRDLHSAEIDGVTLAAASTSEDRLEALVEKQQIQDLRALLLPADRAAGRTSTLSAETGR